MGFQVDTAEGCKASADGVGEIGFRWPRRCFDSVRDDGAQFRFHGAAVLGGTNAQALPDGGIEVADHQCGRGCSQIDDRSWSKIYAAVNDVIAVALRTEKEGIFNRPVPSLYDRLTPTNGFAFKEA